MVPSVSFQQSAVNSADRAAGVPYSFTGISIGTATSTRQVVVAVGSRTAVGTPVIDIGGVTATIHASDTSPDQVWIASANVTTGTTATIDVTFSGAATRCGIGVWAVDNATYTGQSAVGANGSNFSVTTAVGDVVIAAAYEHGTTGSTATWTGATERYDQTVETDMTQSGADTIATTTSTTLNVTFSATVGASVVGVAFG